MQPDDDVCLCFHVSLRKIRAFLERENPPVASLISDCLGAGTGCRWCVPFLERLHAQHMAGQAPTIGGEAGEYAAHRAEYKRTGARPDERGDAAE